MKHVVLGWLLLQILAPDKPQSLDYINNLATRFRDHRFKIAIPVRERQNKVEIITSNTSLYYYYLNHKQSAIPLKFDIFLARVIKGEILLNAVDLNIQRQQEVDFSSMPILLYHRKGFQAVKDHYFNQDSQKRLVLRKEFNKNDLVLNGLMYVMFLNNYYIQFGDYSGYLYCFKN